MLRCWKRLRLTQLASSDMRMSAEQRFGRHFSMIALVSILAGTIGNTRPSAAADAGSTEQLQYQVQHSKFGKIGTLYQYGAARRRHDNRADDGALSGDDARRRAAPRGRGANGALAWRAIDFLRRDYQEERRHHTDLG